MTDSDGIAIEARGLGVRYDLRQPHEQTFRRSLAAAVGARPASEEESFYWGLRDVDFVVRSGEILGVIGNNGSGKSTLLQVIASIISPDEGSIRVAGHRPTLLTLGAGFERELTGRENIRLNAAYLGFSRKEIERLIEPIGEFSELGLFLDQPLKKYSTGMRARLGFAIAVHTKPDILLLDEVLSVGDAGFQEKSRLRMLEMMTTARAIVVVSHSAQLIEKSATKVLWLEKGHVRDFGEPQPVIAGYRKAIAQQTPPAAVASVP